VRVRAADESDIEALARLRAEWRELDASDDYLAGFADWFRREQDGRWWFVADDGGRAVGMVNVKLFDRMPSPDRPVSRWGYLANLYVAPDRRGDGIGSALVAAVVERARSEGLVRLVLSPSEQAIPLYRRHGFRPATDLVLLPLDG
jgi:GNAT superfamily N-acetyltransferase